MMAPNASTLWAEIFVAALARAGLRTVCIAPGSRSTPLTVAFSKHPDIKAYSLLDERGAAFFALGLAQASDIPGALLCTSGTAAANFFPAIIEANYAEIPLLVLTTDRPHELHHSGANQTIDQIKLFGDHVRWFVDVGLPEIQPSRLVMRSLDTLAQRAMAVAMGQPAGAVHLNFPFRKPLEPTPLAGDSGRSSPVAVSALDGHFPNPVKAMRRIISRGNVQPSTQQVDMLVEIIRKSPRGIIFCGPRCPSGDFPQAVTQLSNATGYPVLADALSGVRFGPHVEEARGLILAGYETFWPINGIEPPQVVIRFGSMPISKTLGDFFASASIDHHVQISASPTWQDDTHTTTDFIQAEPALLCQLVAKQFATSSPQPADTAWTAVLQETERTTWQIISSIQADIFFEGAILPEITARMPEDALLFVSSSLPVRHLDQFTRPRSTRLRLFANRGASGIDGTIASALGVGAATDKPLVLVIGDLAFYHDMNSLLALRRCGVKATIVLINNNGGGIFHRLPIAQFDPPFTNYFVTPHDLDFGPVAQMFGLIYQKVTTLDNFQQQFSTALDAPDSHIIEFTTDALLHEQVRRSVVEQVRRDVSATLSAK